MTDAQHTLCGNGGSAGPALRPHPPDADATGFPGDFLSQEDHEAALAAFRA
ncbi:hypothetical protein DAETH_29740 [Deinococcus aetherius]|uniref:Uncharacterized protein n=1 Tax=Deinococcus aetherius TaxID=200252 RepID=A0ABM8AH48_9DEIO|nr:hypothetical protein [Deinococcus aetherius]BDP43005.1 hypothetical protein DAETH_29740 [Deinococcus aetherius]